jgi:Acetyltransferase (GNAT) family
MAEERGRGIAGQRMQAISAWLVQQDAPRVCVNVHPENVAARGFYAKYGDQAVKQVLDGLGRRWRHWRRVETGKIAEAHFSFAFLRVIFADSRESAHVRE